MTFFFSHIFLLDAKYLTQQQNNDTHASGATFAQRVIDSDEGTEGGGGVECGTVKHVRSSSANVYS